RWVELFLDDDSKGEKKWPKFEWQLSNMTDGKHTLRAVVRDLGGNTSTTSISVTVDSTCADAGTCTEGKRGISEPCSRESSCNIGLCVMQTNGDGTWCSTFCTPDTAACAPGMQCVLHEDGVNHYCAGGDGPLILKTNSGDHVLACQSLPGQKTSVPPLMLLALGLLLFVRRLH
ncbi:hypothetical protein KJ865_05245, partial [Myxococcota bacterium]|nr:hypothetical protein [Myxococcota bacterium]